MIVSGVNLLTKNPIFCYKHNGWRHIEVCYLRCVNKSKCREFKKLSISFVRRELHKYIASKQDSEFRSLLIGHIYRLNNKVKVQKGDIIIFNGYSGLTNNIAKKNIGLGDLIHGEEYTVAGGQLVHNKQHEPIVYLVRLDTDHLITEDEYSIVKINEHLSAHTKTIR